MFQHLFHANGLKYGELAIFYHMLKNDQNLNYLVALNSHLNSYTCSGTICL